MKEEIKSNSERDDNELGRQPEILKWFVNRHGELDRFRKILDQNQKKGQIDRTQIFLIEGLAGIGKSWLLDRFRVETEKRRFPVCNVDFATSEVTNLLWFFQIVSSQLGENHFKNFYDILGQGIDKGLFQLNDKDQTKWGDIKIGDNVKISDSQIALGDIFNFGPEAGQNLLQIWMFKISNGFLDDIKNLVANKKLIFLLDSMEKASRDSLDWLQNFLFNKLDNNDDSELRNVIFAIAGEKVPDYHFDWEGIKSQLCLDPLPALEVKRYLEKFPALKLNEELLDSIYQVTDGNPFLVSLIPYYPHNIPKSANKAYILELLINGILEGKESGEGVPNVEPVPEAVRETLRLAAIPEWINKDILNCLTEAREKTLKEKQNSDDQVSEVRDLLRFPFVSQEVTDTDIRYRIHQSARNVLLQSLRREKRLWESLNQAMVDFFAPDLKNEQEINQSTIQAVGHQLAYKEDAGRIKMFDLFKNAEAKYSLSSCEQLLKRAKEVISLGDETRNWISYLEGRLALLQDQATRAAADFHIVRGDADPSSELYVLASQGLGEALAAQGDWPAAVSQYLQVLEYYKGKRDKAGLGRVQLLMGTAYLDEARSLGPPFEPRLERASGPVTWLRQVPGILISLPFILYAWLIRHWRFLPPLQQTMDYRNWTLMRLLLSSVYWTREAEATFKAENLSEELPLTWRRLGQAYHLLGWWNKAKALFQQARESNLAAANRYWKAQVLVEQAEAEHAAGDLKSARGNLKESADVFKHFEDETSAAEAGTLLGQVHLEDGKSASGLELLAANLPKLAAADNRLAAGLALHRLRSWLQRRIGSSEEQAAVRQLVDDVQDQVFLARVPDRTAAALEAVVAVVLGLALVIGVVALAASFGANLISAGSFIAGLISPANVLRTLAWLALLAWCLLVGIALVGLLLVTWSARRHARSGGRREFGSAVVEGVAVDPGHLALVDRHGKPLPNQRLAWDAIEAWVTVERVLWRTPLALVSGLRLFGQGRELPVPATVLWYEALKTEIDDNLDVSGVRPSRLRLDLRVMRSRTGLAFILGVLLLLAGSALIYRWRKLPVSVELAAALGPLLMYLAVIALITGPYWWLVLYPLWVRYNLRPRSVAPFLAALAGAVLVAVAFYLHLRVPYFGILPTLNRFFFPLGFVLILAMPLWILLARQWERTLSVRGDPAYPPVWRVTAALAFIGALTLTGIFAEREWYYDATHNYPAITYFYYEDYLTTVDLFSQQIDADRNLANAYYYRGRAYLELEQPAQAVADFQQIIQSGQAAAAHYWLSANARFALEDYNAACADLTVALTTRQWPLSTQEKSRAGDEFTKLCANNQ